MRVFEKILCPIDFSETSTNALRWTEYLAKRYHSSVVILHSVEIRDYADPFISDYGRAVSKAQSALKEFLLPLKISYEVLVGTRDAVSEIAICAERSKATTIVMGTHGLKGMTHKLIGSTTEECIRHSTRPIFTISPHCTLPPNREKMRILLPLEHVDMLASAYSVFDEIIQEAGASFSLMHVVGFKEPVFQTKSEVIPLNTFTLEAEQTHVPLRKLGEAMVGRDESVETIVDFGDVAEGILKEASTGKYDFILMGAKKERFLSRFFDSVVYSVMSESPIPVITAKMS